MSWIICDLCGGKTRDLEKHRKGSTRQCWVRRQHQKARLNELSMEEQGWVRVSRAGRLIHEFGIPVRLEATLLGPDLELQLEKWTLPWAYWIAAETAVPFAVRRRAIAFYWAATETGDAETLAALDVALKLAGSRGVANTGVPAAVALIAQTYMARQGT